MKSFIRMRKNFIVCFRFLLIMTVLTGILYPAVVTVTGYLFFRRKAGGSLVYLNGRLSGSELLGQEFSDSKYFWPRPSASGYNTLPSSGSNLGLSNPELRNTIVSREKEFIAWNGIGAGEAAIPAEMVCASASGLDPDISPEAARLQARRVAAARGFDRQHQEMLMTLIAHQTRNRQFYILGEPRINVFLLNLMLDNLK